jgi:hypothetical protein
MQLCVSLNPSVDHAMKWGSGLKPYIRQALPVRFDDSYFPYPPFFGDTLHKIPPPPLVKGAPALCPA